MPQDEKTIILALGAAALIVTLYYVRPKKNVPPFPPGPKGVPVLGNVVDLPQSQPWVTFSRWAKEHGPIVHLRVFGKSIIVLNDVKYATDMLDKKSRIYSNRPTLIMGGELVGWAEGPALIQFGKTWADYRRLMAPFLGTRSKIELTYNDVLEKATQAFLNSVLLSPDMWKDHGYRCAGAIVLKIAYGYQAKDNNDPLVTLVDEAMHQFSELTAANSIRTVRYHKTLQTMLDTPFEWVKKQMAMGTSMSCFVSELLDLTKSTQEEERLIKWGAAGIYSGELSMHTYLCIRSLENNNDFQTAAVIETFFLAMVLQPDAQRKAQRELEEVLGHCATPSLADRPRLPYTGALISEIFRRYTIGPLGLPHVAAEDDVHNGFFIPKDAIILTNNWLFYRDRKTYADPEVFRPERFIETAAHKKEKDPRDMLFGYGRRAFHLADASMWLLFASILVFFDISAPFEDGRPLLPSGRFLDGSISRPEQFKCAIKPRRGAKEAIHRLLEA
ncbi:cytochrome P450 [Mycena galericulata]|nr:cytochrome P450 [Mycena galericulata]